MARFRSTGGLGIDGTDLALANQPSTIADILEHWLFGDISAPIHTGAVSLTADTTVTVGASEQIHQTTVSLTATPTVTISAIRTTESSVSLSVISTSTIGAVQINWGAVNLTAAPTITVTAPLRTLLGLITLSVSGTFDAVAGHSAGGSVSLSVSSSFSSDATVNRASTVSLNATTTISITASRIAVSSVSLLASATLTAAAISFAVLPGLVSLTTESVIAINATLVVFASVSLNAIATFTPVSLSGFGTVGLSVVPSLNVGASMTAIALASFISTPTIQVQGFAQRFANIVGVVETSISVVGGLLTQFGTVELVVFATINTSPAQFGFGTLTLVSSQEILVLITILEVILPITFQDLPWTVNGSQLADRWSLIDEDEEEWTQDSSGNTQWQSPGWLLL